MPDFEERLKYGIFAELFFYDIPTIYFGSKRKKMILDLVFNKHDFFVNAITEEQTREFYNQTIEKKGYGTFAQHSNMPIALYGGHGNVNIGKYCIVEYKKGKSIKKSIVGLPIQIIELAKTQPNAIINYLEGSLKINNVSIIKDNIKKFQLLRTTEENQNCYYYLVGPKEIINAKQLWLPKKTYLALDALLNEDINQEDFIKKYDVVEMFDFICNKVKTEYPYYKKFIEEFYSNRDLFIKETKQNQASYLKQLLSVTKADSQRVEKVKIGDIEKTVPSTRLNGKSLDKLNPTIIFSSITGMFSQEY